MAEHLERRTGSCRAVLRSGSTRHAQRNHSQQAFKHHGAVAHLKHVFFIGNRFGGSAAGNKAVETGNGTAGNRDKQDREQIAELIVVETGVDRQIHGRMGHHKADDSRDDHADEHERGHVVTGLLEQPHGKHGGKRNVDEGDDVPGILGSRDRQAHAEGKRRNREHKANHNFLPAGRIPLALDQAKEHGEQNKQQGDRAGSAVGGRGICQDGGIRRGEGIEGSGDHIGKGCDDKKRKQPAEQQEQLAAEAANVFFNDEAHGLAFVLHAGIQRAEVRDCAEENAAQQQPQQHRQPAESGCLNGAGDRARARNGAELVTEHSPTVCRNVIFAVVFQNGRRFGSGINAPFFGNPTPVKGIGQNEADRCNQDDDQGVHKNLSSWKK